MATRAAALGAPVTITLSAPSPVPVLSPVVGVSNSMFLGSGAEIVTGPIVAMGSGIHAEPDALLNDTWSRGTADLRDRVKVRGTLHAASRVLGNSVTINASDTAPAFDPPTKLAWTVTYPSSVTGPDVLLNAGQSKSLTPGQYGALTLNSQAAVTLAAGTYYLKSLDLESQSTLKLDQASGPVIIYIDTSLILRGSIVSLTTDPPDLLIAYLGTNSFLVETLFNGAIVAPLTTVTLRAVNGIHTGFFYAKDLQILDAHARVQYRAPLAVLKAAQPDPASCSAIVQALVPAGSLNSNLARYCGACPSSDDTDGDGIQDCLDACPYDRNKTTSAGVCGCGVSEIDTDGDKVPDCIDLCPKDPNNTSPGQCGCLGEPGLQPAGTACNDTACPQSSATCNGSGICGNRSACLPATGCKLVTFHESSYWACLPSGAPGGSSSTPLTENAAQLACSAKGETLARIDSLTENRFINHFLTAPLWLGANDISVSNAWRWSAPNTNNGDQFWSGGATGAPVGNRFAFWAPGAPGTQRCAAMDPKLGGQWTDVSCSEALGYVCEFHVPVVRGPGNNGVVAVPGLLHQPPAMTTCMQESDSGLPGTMDELAQQVAASKQGNNTGAGANPPPSNSTCPDDPLADGIALTADPSAGCQPVNVDKQKECIVDADCASEGAGFVCRQLKDLSSCNPVNVTQPVPGDECLGHARCMQPSCPPAVLPCDQRDVCGPEIQAQVDTGSNLTAQPLKPESLFGGTLPTATASTQYTDPPCSGNLPCAAGEGHAWCSLNPQDPNSVKPASQPSPPYHGQSGTGKKISFAFDPRLTFDADPGVAALGESDLKLHAAASLTASVTVTDFIGQNFSTDIFNASIGMQLDRCAINDTDDTKFKIFGLDALTALGLGLPPIDSREPSDPLHGFSTDCINTFGKFRVLADRSKKAFRDAQTLVTQFNNAKVAGKILGGGNLCQQIQTAAKSLPFFPGGSDCPVDEPAEITINRFVDFYQAPGFSEMSRLRNAQSDLSAATTALEKAIGGLSLGFGGTPHEESQTILNTLFLIGPVPVTLQVDVFAQYGVTGSFDLSLNVPIAAVTDPSPAPIPVAKVTARAAPFAGAGLSAFVGAGADFGPIAATVGIEGVVTLAQLSAPIFAGVGLDMLVTKDSRPLPPEVLSAVVDPNAFQFKIPKAFKFAVNYDYGAGVDVNNVLSGEINGRLRIRFFLFSRTWRKRIVKFDGWSQHFDLISGGSDPTVSSSTETVPGTLKTADNTPDTAGLSTTVASGSTTMGLSEAPVPLMVLQRLPLPAAGAITTGTGTDFDKSAVESLFYDSLCCVKPGEVCQAGPGGRPECCPGSDCVLDPTAPLAIATCVVKCKAHGEDCSSTADCCQPPGGLFPNVCGSEGQCRQCSDRDQGCGDSSDCCGDLACDANATCQPVVK